MLQDWGSRVWTFPEVLLSKEGVKILVYQRRNHPHERFGDPFE